MRRWHVSRVRGRHVWLGLAAGLAAVQCRAILAIFLHQVHLGRGQGPLPASVASCGPAELVSGTVAYDLSTLNTADLMLTLDP